MHTAPILAHVARHVSLDPIEESRFTSALTFRELTKNDFLLEQGKPCTAIYFVLEGALRAFHYDSSGKEATIMFAVADWWITDMPCFVSKEPALISIQAISRSSVLALRKEDMDALLLDVPKFERFFRILMQNAYIREQLRVLQNISLPAETRYQNFLSKYPQIVQQVPQKHIASYLGITPEFLSAIRKPKKTSVS